MTSRFPVFAACLLVTAFFAGCKTTYTAHMLGDQRIVARCSGRTLFAELPRDIKVPAVIGAADEVTRGRGYTAFKKTVTDEAGTLYASPPGRDEIQRVVIKSNQGQYGTEIYVSYEPIPDRELCESLFDAILKKLVPPAN